MIRYSDKLCGLGEKREKGVLRLDIVGMLVEPMETPDGLIVSFSFLPLSSVFDTYFTSLNRVHASKLASL